MPVLLYANDVLKMANQFVDLAKLRTSGTELRTLDSVPGSMRLKSLEESNKDIINASFFGIHFGHKIEEQESGGVKYALKSKKYLNNENYALLQSLQPGNAQFFDFGEIPGPTTESIWVSAEGFFYILNFRPADVQQKKFDSPCWVLQAGFNNNLKEKETYKGKDKLNSDSGNQMNQNNYRKYL